MKITSGDYKYRKLEVPKNIRPTTEKVREAIFSMIRPWIPGAVVVDLFAGSGALGLEALSRGADKCYFNEVNRQNFKILAGNVNHCQAGDKAVLSNKDYQSCIAAVRDSVDVVIMDPPYGELEYYDTAFEMLQEYELLEDGSIVVAEHLYNNKLSERYGNLVKIKEKKYGSIGVDVFILELPEEE